METLPTEIVVEILGLAVSGPKCDWRFSDSFDNGERIHRVKTLFCTLTSLRGTCKEFREMCARHRPMSAWAAAKGVHRFTGEHRTMIWRDARNVRNGFEASTLTKFGNEPPLIQTHLGNVMPDIHYCSWVEFVFVGYHAVELSKRVLTLAARNARKAAKRFHNAEAKRINVGLSC